MEYKSMIVKFYRVKQDLEFKMPASKFSFGSGFKVGFESTCFFIRFESDHCFDYPWSMFGGMRNMTMVVRL